MASAEIFDGSFVNHFWGKDERGSELVFQRMFQGQQTCQELIDFYKEKMQLEEEYAMKLKKLSRKKLGDNETGTIKNAFEVLKKEYANMGDAHLKEVQDIENEILAPLFEFSKSFENEKLQVEKITKSILKSKSHLFQQMEKAKNSYSNDCIKLYNLYSKNQGENSSAFRSQVAQLESQLTSSRRIYEESTKEYKKISDSWVTQWQGATNDLQELEIERMNYLKTNIWNLLNVTATTCVQDDKCCENVRMCLEKCDSYNDIKGFVETFKTGSEIYEAPEFVDFLQGGTEEDNMKHSIANFENSFSSMSSSVQFGKKKAPESILPSKNKQVTFTSSTNVGSSYYGDSLTSRMKHEDHDEDIMTRITKEKRLEDRHNDVDFKKQFDSLNFKKNEEDDDDDEPVRKIEIKSPFGTIQTVSRPAATHSHQTQLSLSSSPIKQTQHSPTSSTDGFNHNSDTASSSGSSTGESNSLVTRQSTNASSQTSSNFSNSSNKTWSSPTRRRSKLGMQGWMSDVAFSNKKPTTSTSVPDLNDHQQRMKEEKQAQVNRYYEQNKNDDSILNTSTMRNFNPEEVGVEDPLRAALEDLKIGGNGDFNALKERHNSIKSNRSKKHTPKSQSSPAITEQKEPAKRKSMVDMLKQASSNPQMDLQSSQHQQKHQSIMVNPQPRQSNGGANPMNRPKSMIEIAEMNSMKSSMQTNANFSTSTSTVASRAPKQVPLAPNGLPLISSNGRPVLRHAKAIYEYNASIPEEVTFKRKDLMLVLAMQDDGWWEVEVLNNRGSRFGLAPSNYLVPA
ncbi:hypothetical protein DASC09_003950 [Saccharomycopsis crataegensis]|uniref:Septation protein imp2 n=1 Tax=Saccharomycopsis crataegensis TaxID=43959 RepID=A0AAV5QDQ1_9ASCO|nr:hypothetical protein DASC09_003950 [Saccharomycopsis crataegensis]